MRRDNVSIPDKNDEQEERSSIIAEERDKRRVADLDHQIQHSKSKAYYKASSDQHSINTCQRKVCILEEMMEAEGEYGQKNMHSLKYELDETKKKSSETVADTRYDAHL